MLGYQQYVFSLSIDSQVDPAHVASWYGCVGALHSLNKNGINIMMEDPDTKVISH